MAKKKNDSEKDLLFSKLLPSLNDNPFSITNLNNNFVDDDINKSNNSISDLRDQLFSGRQENYSSEYSTINIMEHLVLKNINLVAKRFNVCMCDRCRCDIAAYALNNLPPKYIVSNTDDTYDEKELSKLVLNALVSAVLYVKSNSNH